MLVDANYRHSMTVFRFVVGSEWVQQKVQGLVEKEDDAVDGERAFIEMRGRGMDDFHVLNAHLIISH